jgi:hypothetical protein
MAWAPATHVDETANSEERAQKYQAGEDIGLGAGCFADSNLVIDASMFDKMLCASLSDVREM